MKKMLTNNDSRCPSHDYSFEVINLSAKAWHQQFDLVPLIHLCNVISLVVDK
jgi:hypothetical protein